jgi:hypothetical protein
MNLFIALHNVVIVNASYAFFAGVGKILRLGRIKTWMHKKGGLRVAFFKD